MPSNCIQKENEKLHLYYQQSDKEQGRFRQIVLENGITDWIQLIKETVPLLAQGSQQYLVSAMSQSWLFISSLSLFENGNFCCIFSVLSLLFECTDYSYGRGGKGPSISTLALFFSKFLFLWGDFESVIFSFKRFLQCLVNFFSPCILTSQTQKCWQEILCMWGSFPGTAKTWPFHEWGGNSQMSGLYITIFSSAALFAQKKNSPIFSLVGYGRRGCGWKAHCKMDFGLISQFLVPVLGGQIIRFDYSFVLLGCTGSI